MCGKESSILSSKSDTDLQIIRKDKKVRFADTEGLSLVSVCMIPFRGNKSHKKKRSFLQELDERSRLLNFTQPLTCPDFPRRIERLNVCLENVSFKDSAVIGAIKVRNLSYEKRVFVRYTLDNWRTLRDVPARYISGSSSGLTDTFSFEITLNETLEKDSRLEMAICYEVLGTRFWDNNYGDNYRVKCFSAFHHNSDFWIDLEIYRSRFIGDIGLWF